MKEKVSKVDLIKKGKQTFGDSHKFNVWLNTENEDLNCKPISLYEKKYKVLYEYLNKKENAKS
jgi:hypothetical protein